MPVQITINGADAAESIRELSALAAAISGQKIPTLEAPPQEVKSKRQRTTKAEATAKEPEKPDVTEDEGRDGNEDTPTLEELRETASAKGKTAGKEAVKALLNEFGGSSLTTLPEEQRAAFLARLKAL